MQLEGQGPFYESTRITCSFHSDDGYDGSIGEGNDTVGYIDSAAVSKSFGDAAGSWSLRIKMKPGTPPLLSHYADPEDVWTRIQARINGHVYDLTLGLIGTIAERETTNRDGSIVRVYDITGRDFGKAFSQYELFINFWPTNGPPVPQFVQYTAEAISRNLPNGSPDQVVRGLIEMWLGNGGAAEKQWMLPGSLRGSTGNRYLFDWLNLGNISRDLRGQLANEAALLSPDAAMTRTLWDALQEYSHSLLNEMWVDLAPDPDLPNRGKDRLDRLRPSVFLRERPFPTIVSSRRWEALHTVTITANEVKDRALTFGDDGGSRFNWWELIPNGISGQPLETQALMQDGDGLPGGMPIYNLDSIRRHGLRRYSQSSKYLALPAGERGDPSFIEYAKRWTRIVHDWYVIAPYQCSGMITLGHMRPDIRIGMKLRDERANGEVWVYYVEGVDHSFSFNGGQVDPTTKLTVTRGQKETKNYLRERVYASYAGLDTSTLSDAEVREASPGSETASDAPTLSTDPDVPLPPESSSGELPGAGTGAGDVETSEGPDGELHTYDATTDAGDDEMVSPPDASEDQPFVFDVSLSEVMNDPTLDDVETDPTFDEAPADLSPPPRRGRR